MQAVKSRETKPEMQLRKTLHRLGMRYRVDCRPEKDLRCKADLVFRRVGVCVFIDGCFWHGCPQHFHCPDTNSDWWLEKINDNRERDERQRARLTKRGWLVIEFWEHELREDLESCANRVRLTVSDRSKWDMRSGSLEACH